MWLVGWWRLMLSGFWTWLGSVVLLSLIASIMASALGVFKR